MSLSISSGAPSEVSDPDTVEEEIGSLAPLICDVVSSSSKFIESAHDFIANENNADIARKNAQVIRFSLNMIEQVSSRLSSEGMANVQVMTLKISLLFLDDLSDTFTQARMDVPEWVSQCRCSYQSLVDAENFGETDL